MNGQVLFQNFEDLQHAQEPLMGSYLMLDALTATDVGWWRRWPFKQASLDVTGLTTGTIKLYGSNAAVMPANGFTVVVGGSATATDTPSISIVSDQLPGGKVTGSYVVQGGDSLNDVAAGLCAALKAALAAIVPLTHMDEQAIAAGQFNVSVSTATITVKTTNPDLFFKLTKVAGATETLTIAQLNTTANEAASVTASGITQIPLVAQWFKVGCTALTTGTPTAIVNGYS